MNTSLKIIFYLTLGNAVLFSVNEAEQGGAKDERWDDIEPQKLLNATSETVEIKCPYARKCKNEVKFLCKGKNHSNCEELICTEAQNEDVVQGRFSLMDHPEKMYFSVQIKNLTKSDSGTYWCGIGETLQHDSGIQLVVDSSKGKDLKGSDNGKKSKGPSRRIWVVAVLLCIPLLVFVFMKYRQGFICTHAESPEKTTNPGHKPNSANTQEAENEDHNYEEVHFGSPPTRPLPSVYATVSAPLDQLPSLEKEKETLTDVKTNQTGDPQAPISTLSATVKISEKP